MYTDQMRKELQGTFEEASLEPALDENDEKIPDTENVRAAAMTTDGILSVADCQEAGSSIRDRILASTIMTKLIPTKKTVARPGWYPRWL